MQRKEICSKNWTMVDICIHMYMHVYMYIIYIYIILHDSDKYHLYG
jgi:hypothetical protein